MRAALHLHHRGNEEQALELIRAGLFSGIKEFDSSIGGLGGCPFTENSGANISTESLVRHLTAWGFDCGVNKTGLTNASKIAEKIKLNELAIVI
jgi:hydroxymethylglutaryl-CoA lyase